MPLAPCANLFEYLTFLQLSATRCLYADTADSDQTAQNVYMKEQEEFSL